MWFTPLPLVRMAKLPSPATGISSLTLPWAWRIWVKTEIGPAAAGGANPIRHARASAVPANDFPAIRKPLVVYREGPRRPSRGRPALICRRGDTTSGGEEKETLKVTTPTERPGQGGVDARRDHGRAGDVVGGSAGRGAVRPDRRCRHRVDRPRRTARRRGAGPAPGRGRLPQGVRPP